jgi:hypothetical protein
MAIGVGIFVPSIPLMASQSRGSLPSDIANLGLWLKADAGVTLVGGAVDAWADQSGNGRDFSAPAPTNRPAYSGTLNGLPVLTFDGSTDYLTGNAASFTLAQNVSGLTMIAVVKYATGTIQRAFAISSGLANDASRAAFGVTATQWSFVARRLDAVAPAIISGGTSNENHVIQSSVLRYSQATGAIFVNSASQVDTTLLSAGSTSNTSSLRAVVGVAIDLIQFLNGDIAEVIIYQRALSAPERNSVERYLSVKWGIAI